jgi:hypothetical protein
MKAPGFRIALLALSLVGLTACKPEAPPTDEPPEPKAIAATSDATELRDAIKQPIDQAKAVEGVVQEAADKNSAAIEAAAQ